MWVAAKSTWAKASEVDTGPKNILKDDSRYVFLTDLQMSSAGACAQGGSKRRILS